MKKKSLQATCKDMKAEVTKAASMVDYNIKAKHMNNMGSFFASKNFELVTRLPTPPGEKLDPKAAAEAKKNEAAKAQVIKTASGQAQVDAPNEGELDDNKNFVCKENIEKDGEELAK